MDDRNGYSSRPSGVETMKSIAALIATGIGLLIILLGLKYCVDVVTIILGFLKEPESLNATLTQWVHSLNWEAFDIISGKSSIPVSGLLALLTLAGALIIVAVITMGMMRTGARIVSWTTGDREAVREILQYAFGRSLRPGKAPAIDSDRSSDKSKEKP